MKCSRQVLGRTRDELVLLAHHDLLQQHEVGERGDVLEALAHELREPGQGLGQAEEAVLSCYSPLRTEWRGRSFLPPSARLRADRTLP